jgi:hypothetical protein
MVEENLSSQTREYTAGPYSAREVGALEAQVAELKLRLRESHERERRLAEQALLAEENLQKALSVEHDLRTQLHRYAEFNQTLKKSSAWRLIQFLRRLVGREW